METNSTADITPVYTSGGSKISCLNRFILIERIVESEVSKSGLQLSAKDSDEIRYKKGSIKAVGALVTPGTLKEGDNILFDKYQGHQIRIDGVAYTLIQEKDVVVCFPR